MFTKLLTKKMSSINTKNVRLEKTPHWMFASFHSMKEKCAKALFIKISNRFKNMEILIKIIF